MTADPVFTIGHSTHPIDEFLALLGANGVQSLVDVRTVPGSRHNPQFGQDALAGSMRNAGIAYQRIERLGGLRHSPAASASTNGAWRNRSFRNYADYMQTPEFALGMDELLDARKQAVVCIMCAEAVPWRCHRSLIGDALLVRGVPVIDIMSLRSARPHEMTKFAAVDGHAITYPPTENYPGPPAVADRAESTTPAR